jgi:hypothetical protein
VYLLSLGPYFYGVLDIRLQLILSDQLTLALYDIPQESHDPLLLRPRTAGHPAILGTVANEMKQQLGQIPTLGSGALQGQPDKSREIVPEPFRRDEADRVPPGVINIFNSKGVEIARSEQGIMVSAFAAMGIVGEVGGPGLGLERLPNQVDNLLISSHGSSPYHYRLTLQDLRDMWEL